MTEEILDNDEETNEPGKAARKSLNSIIFASICFFISLFILYINPAEHTLYNNEYDYASIIFILIGLLFNWISVYFVIKSFKAKEKKSTIRSISLVLNALPIFIQIFFVVLIAFEYF